MKSSGQAQHRSRRREEADLSVAKAEINKAESRNQFLLSTFPISALPDMLELIDTCPDISVQESEYKRLLGYPGHHVMVGRSRELAEGTRQWYAEHGEPWIYVRQTEDLELANERLKISGIEFSSKQLHDQFSAAQAHNAVLVVVSAGKQCEEKARELWHEGKPDEYFFMEMFGSAVVEHLITIASGRICGWADNNKMVALPHYSPGYSGWDMSDQTKLWELIRQQKVRDFPGEFHVMDTGMLRPKKSLLAVVGITRHLDKVQRFRNLVACENCSLPRCQYRRAPDQHSMPQIEDVRRFQSGGYEDSPAETISASGLNHDAKYSINLRALRKWVRERLHLKTLHDGSVEARFRYEGTTCSNLGRPLEFDYHVMLGPLEDGYKIIEATCAPAPGDTGHTCECEYLNNAESFMRSIASEKPLRGRPLNDVLTWERSYSPSGCYCDADRRAHKWGLVFEVIHYALVRQEKETTNDGQTATILK